MQHDIGPNLADEFRSILIKNGIRVEHIDRTGVKINNHLCSLKYNNASRIPPQEFGEYFYGIGRQKFEEMYSQGHEFFILVGGRTLGKNAAAKIAHQNDISLEEKEIISLPRIEHVFIIPFEKFNRLINGISPAQNDQVKINIYINEDFEFLISGATGSKSDRISGDEVKSKYLNTFEQLEIDSTKSTDLRNYFKSIEDGFKQYFSIYRRYRGSLDKVIKVSYELVKDDKDLVYVDEVRPLEEKTEETAEVFKETEITHTEIGGLLVELGNFLGYDTYTVDSSKVYMDKTLGELMKLSSLSRFTDDRILNTAKEIDVIWFENGFPRYAFEVEHTTDFAKGLQRLYQLRYFRTKFYLVATKDRSK